MFSKLGQEFYRDTWIQVDLDRISSNIHLIRKLAPDLNLSAVVKANAYGHGDIQVANTAVAAGVSFLCVALLEEAIRLRTIFSNVRILVLGPVKASCVNAAANYNIDLLAYDLTWLNSIACYNGPELNIHIKVDSGMSRLGLSSPVDIIIADKILEENHCLIKAGVMTHFASADSVDVDDCKNQLQAFNKLVEPINLGCYEFIHTSNSAGLMRLEHQEPINMGRLGLAMYGLLPNVTVEWPNKLRQAISLHSRVVQVRRIDKGRGVGYNLSFVATEPINIAIIPIGYADGWTRDNQERRVEINGRLFPIVGRICMDLMMVHVDDCVSVGDQVDLINDRLTVNDIADELNTISYEIVCKLSDRLPRIYKQNGNLVATASERFIRIQD